VPLLNGAGRKGKVGEALSFGIPIVTTSAGAEGFKDISNSGMIVEDSPESMAKAIYELHENYDHWAKASRLGKEYCMVNLSSNAMRSQISQVISVDFQSKA
jgi:glycosyltransferase involved in cell wall biosynthesis